MLRTAGSTGRKRPRAEAAATAVAPYQQMQWFEGDSGSEDEDSGSTGPSSNNDSSRDSSGREGSVEQECIDLLSDEEENMQEDDDVDFIEILSSDLEDDDVLLVGEVSPIQQHNHLSRPMGVCLLSKLCVAAGVCVCNASPAHDCTIICVSGEHYGTS